MRSLKEYWKAYGGFKAFFSSRYLYCSIVLAALLLPYAPRTPEVLDFPFSAPLQSAPPLLGFTFLCVLFLMAMDRRFADRLKEKDSYEPDGLPSSFLVTAASFTHFAFVQALILSNAVIGSLLPVRNTAYWLFSMWLMLYGLFIIFAAVGAVFELTRWYDAATFGRRGAPSFPSCRDKGTPLA